jgi:hypothetical protein
LGTTPSGACNLKKISASSCHFSAGCGAMAAGCCTCSAARLSCARWAGILLQRLGCSAAASVKPGRSSTVLAVQTHYPACQSTQTARVHHAQPAPAYIPQVLCCTFSAQGYAEEGLLTAFLTALAAAAPSLQVQLCGKPAQKQPPGLQIYCFSTCSVTTSGIKATLAPALSPWCHQ